MVVGVVVVVAGLRYWFVAWPGTTDSHRQQIPSAEPRLAGDSWNPEPPVFCSSLLQSIPEAQLFKVYIVIHPHPWVIHRMPIPS
ncbi:hypothetical protein HDK64DRAFT_277705 [Phyllosticta capitalensis]